ncbi:MAG: ABC transporter permease, partial [Actinomycetales bacterium]|nr:ABC transporter permease [Actinomycetales bacterium]
FTVGVCGMDVAGELWLLVVCAVLSALLGSALGLAASALARTEFQAVQLMPATLFPQLILCGLVMPRAQMPEVLEAISRVFPLTYVVDALNGVARGTAASDLTGELLLVAGFIVLAVVGGSLTLRRRTP